MRLWGLIALAALAGCSETPDCGSANTKTKLTEIYKEKKSLSDYVYQQSSRYQEFSRVEGKKLGTNAFALDLASAAKGMGIRAEPGSQAYELSLKKETWDMEEAPLIQEFNEALSNANYLLEEIVTESKDDSTKKVSCRGSLSLEIKNWGAAKLSDVNYTVEKTSDGDLLVRSASN